MNTLTERFTSRKFLVTLLGAVVVLLASLGIVPIEDDNAWQLIAILMGYAGIEGAADLAGRWRQGQIPLERDESTGDEE